MVNEHLASSSINILELTTKGHLAGDHIFGLLPLMASLLNGAGGTVDGIEDPRLQVELDKPVKCLFLYYALLVHKNSKGSRNLWSLRYTGLHS